MKKNIAEIDTDDSLNIRGKICPENFVRVKLKLEKMENGQILKVILDDGAPMRNVPRSIKEEGHQIIHAEKFEGGYKICIKVNNN